MKLFKQSRTDWCVLVENQQEKRCLFKIIPKREVNAIYFLPDGQRHEQYKITPEEADLINAEWEN